MKILSLSLILLTSTAFASNPQIRICNQTGGLFHAIKVQQDEVGFCKYGPALMDSMSILDVTSGQLSSQAIDAFEKSEFASCEEAGAEEVNASDLEGHPYSLCVFTDTSYVSLETLQAGPGAAGNSQLLRALKIRF